MAPSLRRQRKSGERTIEQLTETNIESILSAEDARHDRTPAVYRTIERLAAFCGTVTFMLLNAAFFAGWVVVNQWGWSFDPYPYTFLLFAVSLEAIFLSILVLISQNIQARESERRHYLDLQINLLCEREDTALLRLILKMASRMGVPEDEQEEVRRFARDTDPAKVLRQIVAAEHRHQKAPSGSEEPPLVPDGSAHETGTEVAKAR